MKSNPPESPLVLSEGYFRAKDGLKLFYRIGASPQKEKRPLVLILHGFGEHILRYVPVVDELRDLPFSFAAFDLRGHGRSQGEPVYVENFKDYLEDLESFLAHLEQTGEVLCDRLILLGHSMGGAIAASYALQKPERVRAVILSAPCLGVNLWFRGLEAFVRLGNALWPHFVIHNPVKPLFLTHDPQEQKQYSTDSFIQRRITFRLLFEMMEGGRRVIQRAAEIKAPLYFLIPGTDKIVRNDLTKIFFEKAGSHDKKWLEYPGFYHEIFKEKDRAKVFEDLRKILGEYAGA